MAVDEPLAVRSATNRRLGRATARLEAFVDTPAAAVACVVAALAVYGVESAAWPLGPGRDAGTYLMYYLDLASGRPAYPQLMLFRTPLAPIFFGPLLQLGGAILVEVAMGIAYAASVLAFAAAARAYGARCALLIALALLLYSPYGALFHQVSSDPIFALLLAFWTLTVVRTARAPATWKFALHGVALLLLTLARPSAQILLLFAVVPLALRAPWRSRIAWAGAFLAVSFALLAAWAGTNALRYGEFTVARTASADVPFYRVFVLDRLVAPENGPASRALAQAVQRRLLPYSPYREYGITLHRFFTAGSDRMWSDLVWVTDRVWGWDSNYAQLRKVALEAIRRHPKPYVSSVASDVRFAFDAPYRFTAPAPRGPSVAPAQPAASDTIVVNGRRLPRPTEGQPIPSYRLSWLESSPDDRVDPDRVPRWRHRADQTHALRLQKDAVALAGDLPNRTASSGLASALNAYAGWYPRMTLWVVAGLLALLVRRPAGALPVAALAALGIVVVVATLLGMPPALEYRVPFDPIFILFALAALTAPRRHGSAV